MRYEILGCEHVGNQLVGVRVRYIFGEGDRETHIDESQPLANDWPREVPQTSEIIRAIMRPVFEARLQHLASK